MSNHSIEYPLQSELAEGLVRAIRSSESSPVKRSNLRTLELMIAPYNSIKGANINLCLREMNHQRPHVHVRYGDQAVSVDIESQKVLDGTIPAKQLKAAQKYIRENKDKFIRYWDSMKQGKNPISEELRREDNDLQGNSNF